MRPARPASRAPHERGQVSVLIIGFALVLAIGVAVVVDASAAYLQRSGLDSLADGAALHGADLGATGRDVYTEGVPAERLRLTSAQVHASVAAYLRSTGAHQKYPGLTFTVGVSADQGVTVELSAPLDLPLRVPGGPDTASIGATGSAVSTVE
ncbi:pilus assembly protein TadG-related protein [Nocardioides pantholopis]|uniref:pilus assembly protein TadG-related protein n=1 Tax=Nocardioides pantholopis TaxID=2483798 RepID=UPI000F078DAE|nr:pilus assembly protein TadG-related protein [Nocardioides pantholopis]